MGFSLFSLYSILKRKCERSTHIEIVFNCFQIKKKGSINNDVIKFFIF